MAFTTYVITNFEDANRLPDYVRLVTRQLAKPTSTVDWETLKLCPVDEFSDQATNIQFEHDFKTRLEGALSIIAHISDIFAELFDLPHKCETRHISSFWYTFFEAMGRFTYSDALATNNLSIALPADSLPLEITAPILVSYVHKGAIREESDDSECDSDDSYEEDTTDHDDSSSVGDSWTYRGPDEDLLSLYGLQDQQGNEPLRTPLELPRDAHIVAGAGPWTHLLLPVVCVGDHRSLIPVLSSVAAQRRVWNLQLPAIGVEISSRDTFARVYVAWVDPLAEDGSQGPVHVARADNRTIANSQHGVFDISDRDSAALLARFLISLRYQFLVLESTIPIAKPGSTTWRYDSVNSLVSDGVDRLKAWVNKNNTIHKYYSAHISNIDMSGPRNPRPKPARSVTFSEDSKQEKKDGENDSQMGGSDTEQTESIAGTQLSASKFAKLKPQPVDRGASIQSWLVQRYALSVPVLKFDETKSKDDSGKWRAEKEFINESIDVYNAMTEFRWPKAWKKESDLPLVAAEYMPLRKQLWDGYAKIKDTDWMKAREPLDESFMPILKRNFPMLLHEVVSAAKGTPPGNYEPNEAEGRTNWDNLTKLFFTEGAEFVSGRVLRERDLILPENTLLQDLTDCQEKPSAVDNVETAFHARLSNWVDQCHELANKASNAKPGTRLSKLMDQTEAAGQFARATLNLVQKLRNSGQLLDRTQFQKRREPAGGICDTVVCLPTGIPLDKSPRGSQMIVLSAKHGNDEPQDDQPGANTGETKANTGEPKAKKGEPKAKKSEKPKTRKPKAPKKETAKPEDTIQLPPEGTEHKDYRVRANDPLLNNNLTAPTSHDDEGLGDDYELPAKPEAKLESESDFDTAEIDATQLQLVTMFVENKRYSHTSALDAINQGRMYCVGGAIFHASAVGLDGVLGAVFNLCTTGSKGTIIMASVKPDIAKGNEIKEPLEFDGRTVYLFERNVRKFSLINVVQAFHFSTVMLRLRARSKIVLEHVLTHLKEPFMENFAKAQSGITRWPKPPKKRKETGDAESAADQTKGDSEGVGPTAGQAEGSGAGPVSSQTEEGDTDIGAIASKIKELNIEGPSGL